MVKTLTWPPIKNQQNDSSRKPFGYRRPTLRQIGSSQWQHVDGYPKSAIKGGGKKRSYLIINKSLKEHQRK